MLIANNDSPKFFPDLQNFHQSATISFGCSVIEGSLNVKCLVAYMNDAIGARKKGQTTADDACAIPACVCRQSGQS